MDNQRDRHANAPIWFDRFSSRPWPFAVVGCTAILGLLASFGLASMAQSNPEAKAGQSQLTIEVSGLKNRNGQACLSLFDGDRGFPSQSDAALRNHCVAVQSDPQVIQIQGLKPGRYAVALLHDSNGDRQANRNRLGIPVEGFGFSRNPVIRTRAPRFEEAAIAVQGKQTKIQIRLNYLL